ncbi:MAG: pantoate--beta-alanine ligase [Microthrixaceae bacterium]
METITTVAALRARLDGTRADGRRVGVVPTMGALHEGHASLVRRAAADCDEVVVTVFVNPLQFAAGEDLGAYPRTPAEDAALSAAAGATLMFLPDEVEMYPDGRDGVLTTVAVPALAGVLEGASRPTHFAGVCVVVAKLFNAVGPCRAYFGEKDFQQLAIIRRMVRDLSFPLEVVGCPTSREPDGLARSSRNVYLDPAERAVAPVLHRALQEGRSRIAAGETDPDAVRDAMAAVVRAAPLGELDYVDVVDADTLQRVGRAHPGCRLLGAVRFGRARLIDNIAAAEPAAGAD